MLILVKPDDKTTDYFKPHTCHCLTKYFLTGSACVSEFLLSLAIYKNNLDKKTISKHKQ